MQKLYGLTLPGHNATRGEKWPRQMEPSTQGKGSKRKERCDATLLYYITTYQFYFAVNLFGGRPTQSRVDLGAILGGLAQTVSQNGGPQIQGGVKFNSVSTKCPTSRIERIKS